MDSLKDKRELKAKRKLIQDTNVKKKAEKRGEVVEDEDAAKEDVDIKDEGEDKRALGKRTKSYSSETPKTLGKRTHSDRSESPSILKKKTSSKKP